MGSVVPALLLLPLFPLVCNAAIKGMVFPQDRVALKRLTGVRTNTGWQTTDTRGNQYQMDCYELHNLYVVKAYGEFKFKAIVIISKVGGPRLAHLAADNCQNLKVFVGSLGGPDYVAVQSPTPPYETKRVDGDTIRDYPGKMPFASSAWTEIRVSRVSQVDLDTPPGFSAGRGAGQGVSSSATSGAGGRSSLSSQESKNYVAFWSQF